MSQSEMATTIPRCICPLHWCGGLIGLRLVLFVGLVIGPGTVVSARDAKPNPAALRGLPGVEVFVDALSPNVEQDGLTKEQLRVDTVLRLRRAGIRMLTENEAVGTLGFPVLYVRVKTAKDPSGLYAYCIDVHLREVVKLERDASMLMDAPTWAVGGVGVVEVTELRRIRKRVEGHVDAFIAAYMAANPRVPQAAAKRSRTSSPLARDVVHDIQKRLQTAGFDPGRIDGYLGPQTAAALRRYQKAHGLPVTGKPDEVTRQTLVLIQQSQERLKAMGFDPGPIDGSLGPQTVKALRRYQNAHGIPATGKLDEATQQALGSLYHIQERLKAAGFDPGPADGHMGLQTQEALRRYQNAHGLPATGELDDATRRALGVE